MTAALVTAMAMLGHICAVIIFAEAINKLERTDPLAPGITPRQRATAWLKACAWFLFALGAAGVLGARLVDLDPPTPRELLILAAFAILIVRTRVKEG